MPDQEEDILNQEFEQYRQHGDLEGALESAYLVADVITKEYSKSFYFATGMLPKAQRRAIRALYGFCRATDNIVDDPQAMQHTNLDWWREAVNRPWQHQDRAILMAWAHTRDLYRVPFLFGDELIEGCEMDLTLNRYQTF